MKNNLNELNNEVFVPHWNKGKVKSLYIDDMDLEKFQNNILSNLKVGVNYSVLFKFKYDGSYYGMGGSQRGFKLLNINDYMSIELLYKDLIKQMENFMDEYNAESIDLVQLLYIVVSDIPKLKLININNISLNKEFVKVKETRDKFNSKYLPLTINNSYYGQLLINNNRTFYIDKIDSQRKLLGKDSLNLDIIESMYLYNDYIIINSKISNGKVFREIYSASSGALIRNVEDIIINKNMFIRNIGNINLTISKDKVVSIEVKKELSVIKYKSKYTTEVSNPLIGSLDLEAFEDIDGYAKVYAIGYMVLDGNMETFYLDKSKSSDDLLWECFDRMLEKYNGYTFYTHNFGKYDSVFIIYMLNKYNNIKGFEYYKLKSLFKDDKKLLKLDIKVAKKSGYNKITIIDSYNLLNGGLYDLSRSFDLDVVKGYFPHKFVRRDTINYIGNTPSIDYWETTTKDSITKNIYKTLYKKDWNLKEECISYLEKDLESLLKIMNTFNKYILRNYDVQMTDCTTISRLALNIFLKYYLKESKLPIIKSYMFKDIKQAYYGGVTEVYKPHGKNLLYYDVNSLYPFVSLNPIPNNKCTYIEVFGNTGLNLNDLFGYFYCEIETEKNYLGLLPVRSDVGLIMPNGKWKGWYFSEELKFAAINGYKIKIIKGYNFDKQENVFNDYVYNLYKIKSTSIGHIKVIAKSLLNNLLGRFGMNVNKPITEIVNSEKLDLILTTREINSFKVLTEDKDFLITYYPDISQNKCESHGIDYLKALKTKVDMEKDKELKDVSLSTAAAITSYARIYLSKIKLNILSKGGSIYYTDTDSIVTDLPLDKELVGSELGQFKLEYEVKEGYFISAKTYCLLLKDGSTIIKTKGFFNSSFTLKDFKDLYKGLSVKGKKLNTVTVPHKGSVVIGEKEIILDYNCYKKREKLYRSGKWVDTKPLIYNDYINKSNDNPKSNKEYLNNKLNKTSTLSRNSRVFPISISNIKNNFSTYTRKSLNVYIEYSIKKLLDEIIKLLIYMFIIFLISIIYIIQLLMFYYNIDIYLYNELDFTNDLDFLKEVNIDSIWKQEVNKYLNLFKNNINDKNNYKPIIKLTEQLNYLHNKQELYNNDFISHNIKPMILNKVYELHLNIANDEISNLNDEISALKMDILRHKIYILNKSNDIDKIINELDIARRRYTL